MKKESISTRGGGGLIALMVICGTVLTGAGTVKQDMWISILLSGLMFLPFLWIYGRICTLLPGQGLNEMMRSLFGNAIGSALILVYAVYALFVAALTLRCFVEFTVVIALQDTPRIPLMLSILAVVLYLANKGLSLFGKWSSVICVIILINLVFTLLLAMDVLKVSHIKPVMDHSLAQIADNANAMGSIAVGETVLVLAIMGHVKPGKSAYKMYLWGHLVGIAAFALVVLRNLLILGPEMTSAAKFAGYMAVRILHFGTFFERMESIIAFNLILMGITKIALCLSAATMGAAKLLKADDYRRLLLPVSLLVLALCSISFKNAFDMFNFVWAYRYFALPLQVVIPVVVWIVAEIKGRKGKLASGAGAASGEGGA